MQEEITKLLMFKRDYITPAVIVVLVVLAFLAVGVPLAYGPELRELENQVLHELKENQKIGAFGDPWTSRQLATSSLTNGYILQTDGTNSTWVATSSLGISGSGGISSLNGLSTSTQTFATGTATGIGLTITSSGNTHTFTPTVSSGYTIPLTASTTEWAAAYASTTALTPAYIRGLFSGTAPISYNSGTGNFSITNDSVGDTQLAFDTGQHLTTTSAPTFASTTLTNLTSALIRTTSGGLLEEYTGTTCTNQFVTVLSALGVATCSSVGTTTLTAIGYDAGDVLIASSTAAGGWTWVSTTTLGIAASAGGSNTQLQYNNSTALGGTSGLTWNSTSNTLTMTGTSTLATTTITNLLGMTSIDSTSITTIENAFDTVSAALETAIEAALDTLDALTGGRVSGYWEIPNDTNPTVDEDGEIAIDTSGRFGQFKADMGTSTSAVSPNFDKSFPISSSSPDRMSRTLAAGATTTWAVWSPTEPITINNLYCPTEGGTARFRVGNGTNWTAAAFCSATSTPPVELSSLSNNTFVARETVYFQIGSASTTITDWVFPTINVSYTAQ